MCLTYMRTCFTLSTSSEQQSSSENRVELLNSSCSWQFVITSLFLLIAMSVHLNYNQALGHFLLHDLLIAHVGLHHLQDTVQEGEVQNVQDFQDAQDVQGVQNVQDVQDFKMVRIFKMVKIIEDDQNFQIVQNFQDVSNFFFFKMFQMTSMVLIVQDWCPPRQCDSRLCP